MKLDKVYTGFTIDGKDRLLFKKNKIYVDLITDETFNEDCVDKTTLIKINYLIDNKKQMLKRKVINVYKNDRNLNINILFLKKANIYQTKYDGFLPQFYNKNLSNVYEKKVYDDRLVICVLGVYKDLITNKIYNDKKDEILIDELYVDDVRSVYVNSVHAILSKKKVLELSYKKEIY